MAFYMITYGLFEIREAYVGRTEEEAIQQARGMIDQWPEYADMDDEELLGLLHEDRCEFDLVQIQSDWKGGNLSLASMIDLYDTCMLPARQYLSSSHNAERE